MNNSIRNKAPPNFLNLENKNKIEVIFKIITMNNLNKMRTKEFECCSLELDQKIFF